MKSIAISLITLLAGLVLTQVVIAQAVVSDLDQLDFGIHAEETNTVLSVELTNLLDEDITIDEVAFFQIYGTNPFSLVSNPGSIPANGSTVLEVAFSPMHNIMHNSEMVVYTSGNRGAISIDLRGDCNYSNTYYDDTYDLMDEDLKDMFHDILEEGYDQHGYNGARDEMFMFIDNQKENGQGAAENTITRAYLGTDAVGYTSRSNAQSQFNLNTEHTFPQGFFNQDLPMRSDLHHLFVTDVNANSTRANYAFGVVAGTPAWSQNGSKQGVDENGVNVFEPRDAHKGKSARGVLYFVLRYQNYSGFVTASQELVLRDWNTNFPPSEVDVTRNDDIQAYQNNRNPFSDYPQFAERIYSFRLEQNRPNVGQLVISHEEIDYTEIPLATSSSFNVVLTNTGERFMNVSNFSISENSSGVYSLDASLPSSVTLHPGQSLDLSVIANPNSDSDDLEAMLIFETNLSTSPEINLPINASVVTGLRDVEISAKNLLVPNPFSNVLRLQSGDTQLKSIRVYDMTGRMCLHVFPNQSTIDVSRLNAGIYQAIMEDATGRFYTQKLIKQ